MMMVVTTVLGWMSAKLMTKRERKQSDLTLINNAISPLLNSIRELTEHNSSITEKLLDEQTKNLALLEEKAALMAERMDLVNKIDKLDKKVASLERLIKKLTNEKEPAESGEGLFK